MSYLHNKLCKIAEVNYINRLMNGISPAHDMPLKARDNESGAIVEQYGTIANWRAWDDVKVIERATGRRVFDNEVARITGKSLHVTPAEVLAVLNQSTYEVK